MSAKFLGQEHANFFRELVSITNSAISREEHFYKTSNTEHAKKKLKKIEKEVSPMLRGTVLVTMIANIEFLVGKKADGKTWDIPYGWYGKDEFRLLRIIRHCWAHAAGRVLPNRQKELAKFLKNQKAHPLVDIDGQAIQPYFSIDNNKVVLYGLERVRILCCELLAEKGLIEKWY